MPSNYSFRGTANMSQHDRALEKSASEVYKYEKKVQEANRQLEYFNSGVNNTANSINGMMGNLRTGNFNGFLDNIKGMKSGFDESTASANKLGLSIGSFAKGAGIAAVGLMAVDAAQKIGEMTSEGIRLAQEAEGIKHRFQEIGGTNVYLESLRQHTHGLVNDLELMKATVKANDFNIPMKDLGKYLEFAQLKSQQTGESVDYLVNSIVTGLGRQSVQILDNLGLSAAELKEKMAEGKTMTEAVAEVIDNQLKSAGEHFETTAEKAQRKLVELQNEQMRVGEALAPLKSDWESFLTSVEIWAMKAVQKVAALFSEAQRIKNLQEDMQSGSYGSNKNIEAFKTIKDGRGHQKNYQWKVNDHYNKEINKELAKQKKLEAQIEKEQKRRYVSSVGYYQSNSQYSQQQLRASQERVKALKNEQAVFNKVTNSLMNPMTTTVTPTITTPTKISSKSGGRSNTVKQSPLDKVKSNGQSKFEDSLRKTDVGEIVVPYTFTPTKTPEEIKEEIFGNTSTWTSDLQSNIDGLFEEAKKVQIRFDEGEIDVDEAQKMLDNISKMIGLNIPIKLDTSDMDKAKKDFNNIISASESMAEAMGNIGSAFETPELEVGAIIAQAIAALVQQFATVPKGATVWDWIAGAAAGLVTLTATIASIKSATAGYASGGIIGGSTTIGDYNLARVNKGEMILNGSQQAHLFNAINNNRIGGEATQSTVTWKIQGSDLYGTLKNYGKTQSKLGKNIGIK